MSVSETVFPEHNSWTTGGVKEGDVGVSLSAIHWEWGMYLEITSGWKILASVGIEQETRKTDTHVAPSGRMTLTSASSTTDPGICVKNGIPATYLPVFLSYFTESSNGASHPRVNV